MKLVYKNKYGASYQLTDASEVEYPLQLVINKIGLFMSSQELKNLLKKVRGAYGITSEVCNCDNCKGSKRNQLWKTSAAIDVCLKLDDIILEDLEDLIVGTQFMLNMDAVLEAHSIK